MRTSPLFLRLVARWILMLALMVVWGGCGSDSVTGPGNNPAGTLTLMSERDTDSDGIRDIEDSDDDNDGVTDDMDNDDDDDGVLDDDEPDSDDDGTIDDHDDDFAELRGKIESMGSSSFVAFGYTVHVHPGTKIKDDEGLPLLFDALTVGMFVEVHGTVLGEKEIRAREVEVEDEDDDVPLDSLSQGDFVEAKGVPDGNGGWRLIEIHFEPVETPFEYDGPVGSITANTLTMLGIDFVINGSTRFEDETDSGQTLGDLQLGDYVDVRANYEASSGIFTATRIRLAKDPQAFAKVEATVFQVNPGNGTVVVGGVNFHR